MAFKYNDEWKLYQKEQKLDNQYYNQQQAQLNKWNQESAQKQMDFQKMMSDTSHEREVQSLLRAGLNPVLSANNGASTPSGAYANVDSTPLSSASQNRMANRQMRQNMIQNKMQLANAMSIAKYQAQMQYAAQKYATDMSYQLGMSGLQNQMDIALLPYSNVNATEQYVNENPNTIQGALIKGAQGVLDQLFGTSNKSLRNQSNSILGNLIGTAKSGFEFGKKLGGHLGKTYNWNVLTAKNAANYLKNKGFDLRGYTGSFDFTPVGRPYHSNGKPYTDKELRDVIVKYHPNSKSKLATREKQRYSALSNILKQRAYIKYRNR